MNPSTFSAIAAINATVAMVLAATACGPAYAAAAPSAAELHDATRWAQSRFKGAADTAPAGAGLEVRANHGPVQANGRGSLPLRLADAQHSRGFYCHAPSHLRVRLPGPGELFSALVGVDSNSQTSGGRGSVHFAVRVAGKDPFKTALLREGMAAVPVRVELAGTREFELLVDDGGDGIACDQADWAEAKVRLQDGREIWLADLPLFDAAPQPLFAAEAPFSFVYDGQPSRAFLSKWPVERVAEDIDAARTRHTLTWREPGGRLVVRCVGLQHHDYPTVEWTVFLRNAGAADSPILSDLQAADVAWEQVESAEFRLHHHNGDLCTADSYEPRVTRLATRADLRFAPSGGRPTQGAFPYFDLEGQGQGLLLAVGWPGQWAARFVRDAGRRVTITAGQELTRFRLRPGEEVRTPLIVLQFWRDDRVRAHNVWRRWMLARNVPQTRDGRAPGPLLSSCSGGFFPGLKCNEADEFRFIDANHRAGLKLDYWWMDAGWYPCGADWTKVGTWTPDPERFPRGLKAVSDHARQSGMGLIVWFEPERVTPGTWLYQEHPEWLLGQEGGTKLLDLGNPVARQWLTEHVDSLLRREGIGLYRQDFNLDPLPYWRAHDAEDRRGITEIRHVEGYLAYWDELRRRHPGMLIDSCASGGRRNDLETLRRAVPLLRSDYQSFEGDPAYAPGNQGHTYGLASWIPYFGHGAYYREQHLAYSVRSYWSPAFGLCADVRKPGADWGQIRRLTEQWRQVAPCFLGDFYPLTPYRLDGDVWMAWQFDLPEAGQGVVQAFRRDQSAYETAVFPLKGLESNARYRVTDLDVPEAAREWTGAELMDRGLRVTARERPQAVVVSYRRL